MATEKERELMREIMDMALDINDNQEEVNCSIDIRVHGFALRILDRHGTMEWIYYPTSPAYFSDEIFTEDKYWETCKEFMSELKKYHKDYDDDGIRLEVAK